ncbi:hypothetical protein [Streptomyces narbonensis]
MEAPAHGVLVRVRPALDRDQGEYGLTVSPPEKEAVRELLATCG